MDRRRFVPSTEGLEGRALLATNVFGPPAATPPTSNAASTVPATFQLKEIRIERLPSHLDQIRQGRFLPKDLMVQLQHDLLAIAAKLHPPGSAVLEAFNSQMRHITPSSSLSVADAAALNHVFGRAVTAMGATPQQVTNLQDDMLELAKVDANSPQSTLLATNDYATVLQTIIAVGRPIRRPSVPQIAYKNGDRVNQYVGVTTLLHPTFAGYYDAGATVQIIDSTGKVFGQAVVEKHGPTQINGIAQATGRYRLTISVPLAPGLYTFYARAVDQFGNVSNLSAPFKLKVIPRRGDATSVATPAGPLALK